MLGYLPQSYDGENPDVAPYDSAERCDAALNTIIPDDPNQSYDMREVVKRVVGGLSLSLELAVRLVCAGRFGGYPAAFDFGLKCKEVHARSFDVPYECEPNSSEVGPPLPPTHISFTTPFPNAPIG